MTDDTDLPRRPNAKYKLSKPDNAVNIKEEDLTFYYNREHRLKKAPQAVRNLYTEKKVYRFNLLRPLIADKPRAIVFITIIVICATIILLSILGYFDSSYSLDGNNIEISAAKFEDMSIIVLKKTYKKGASPYSGAVDIAVSPAESGEDEEYPVFYHRIFFTLETAEEYRFAVPFDSASFAIVLKTEQNFLQLKIKTK